MMEAFPTGFLYILLGVVAGAILLVVLSYVWKQHRLNRLQNPRRDYTYRRRG